MSTETESRIRTLASRILSGMLACKPGTTLGELVTSLGIRWDQPTLLALCRINRAVDPPSAYDPTGKFRGHCYGKVTNDQGEYVESSEAWCTLCGPGWGNNHATTN